MLYDEDRMPLHVRPVSISEGTSGHQSLGDEGPGVGSNPIQAPFRSLFYLRRAEPEPVSE